MTQEQAPHTSTPRSALTVGQWQRAREDHFKVKVGGHRVCVVCGEHLTCILDKLEASEAETAELLGAVHRVLSVGATGWYDDDGRAVCAYCRTVAPVDRDDFGPELHTANCPFAVLARYQAPEIGVPKLTPVLLPEAVRERIAALETALRLTHDALGETHDAMGEVLSSELYVDWLSLPELTGNKDWTGLKERVDAAWESGKAALAACDGGEG